MRGQQVLFSEFFTEASEAPVLTIQRKGRSEQLYGMRNEALLDRYYYYGKFTDKRYESILDQLSEEFYLSPYTIQERINENFSKLDELKAHQPTKEYFKKKYPHLIW